MKKSDQDTGSSVLITGGSGMVGRNLTSLLLSKGYKVSHLSKYVNHFGRVRVFRWDPCRRIIDPEVFNGIDYIVHLAGENIGDKRWTNRRKKEIAESRINTARFLYDVIRENNIKLRAFISASGIGYYGSETSEKIHREEDPPSNDFLGVMCREWEEAADLFGESGIRTVKIRTAVVLGKNSSALVKLMTPARYGLVIRIGAGRQYMPWIHVADLSGIYLKAIEDHGLTGAFNAAAPCHVNHSDFIRALAALMRRPVILPPVPGFIVRIIVGKRSDVVLKGSRISSDKIIGAGYRFKFASLEDALGDIV